MGLITPDFSEVKDTVGTGTYRTRIVDAKVDKWNGKDGKPDTSYVKWTLETMDEADQKNNGRRIFHNTPIQGPGAFRLKDFWKAASGEELAGDFDPTMVFGKNLEVTIAPQKDRPEYNEVKAVRALN